MNADEHCDAAFKREVRLRCYDALTAAGFTRFRKEGVDWPLDDDFHCWVGLNTALSREYVEINPFVGVHVVPIERLWTSTRVGKYKGKYNRAYTTYAVHMGTLVPDEPVLRFTRQTDIDAEATRVARLYASVGLPYARAIGSYWRLLPLLQECVGMLGANPERVACCLYLMGRRDEARAFVEKFLLEHREYFEDFATPFLKKLAEEAGERARH